MYCPNRECPDFKETGMHGEYVEGITVCPFCGNSLVEEVPDENPPQVKNETEPDNRELDSAQDSAQRLVVIASYSFRQDAELAITFLKNNGVDVVESPDDCGGTNPVVGFATGIRLLAPESQARRAIALLKKAEEGK